MSSLIRALDWTRTRLWGPAKETVEAWYSDCSPRWSAAIAFYTIFSLAPVLIIVTAVAGAFWGEHAVRRELMSQFRDLLGDKGAVQIQALIDGALPARSGLLATVVGVSTLLVGATAVFTTLRSALNAVWGVPDAGPEGVWSVLKGRLLSFAMVLCIAFLLVASLIVSAALSGLGNWIGNVLPAPIPVLQILDLAVSFSVLWLLFAIIFKWLPDVVIDWKDVWIGAAATSLLFTAGKIGIGVYLGRSAVASAYGVAGSVILLLLWVYYSAMIFLLGAEFAQVHARRWGSKIRPFETGGQAKTPARDGFSAPVDRNRGGC